MHTYELSSSRLPLLSLNFNFVATRSNNYVRHPCLLCSAYILCFFWLRIVWSRATVTGTLLWKTVCVSIVSRCRGEPPDGSLQSPRGAVLGMSHASTGKRRKPSPFFFPLWHLVTENYVCKIWKVWSHNSFRHNRCVSSVMCCLGSTTVTFATCSTRIRSSTTVSPVEYAGEENEILLINLYLNSRCQREKYFNNPVSCFSVNGHTGKTIQQVIWKPFSLF